jgi:hypothetical protein
MPMGTRTTGPRHLFVRFRGAATVYYLGTCVAAPEEELHKDRIPIMNDISGRSNPLQIVKDGQNALIYATMNRFDWSLLSSIKGLDATNTANATPLAGQPLSGWELAETRGTLQIGVSDFQLLIWSEYNGVAGASGTANDAPPVRIYASVDMTDMKETTQGTRVLEVACAFKATSVYDYANMGFFSGSGNSARGLYSDVLSVTGTTVAALEALVAAAGA